MKGGKTAHWTLKLPLNLSRTDEPVCSVGRKSVRARLLQETDLIVWDECTMSHRKALEAVDRTLQNIKRSTEIMGNVVVVLTGDFAIRHRFYFQVNRSGPMWLKQTVK